MPDFKSSADPIDIHRLHSILLRFGGSFFGAQQLLSGQIVTDPADRKALAAMILGLLRHSSGKHHAKDAVEDVAIGGAVGAAVLAAIRAASGDGSSGPRVPTKFGSLN